MPRDREGFKTLLPQIVFIVIMAAVLAVGLFLAIPLLQGRPEFPPGSFLTVADGTTILVEMDPDQEVYLIPLGGGTSPEGSGGQGVAQVTPTTVVLPSATPNILPSATPNILPSAPPPTSTPSVNRCIMFIDYAVQAGDTLFSISQRYVTSIPLMARFGISSTSIVPGNVIRLPVGDPSCCTGGWQPYAVTEGESAFSIANQFGTTIQELQRMNGLDASYSVYVASVICVP
ncbi:MAG: LysM peptidoglycan-binding domain-containing protein [Chloroflexota bacterium]